MCLNRIEQLRNPEILRTICFDDLIKRLYHFMPSTLGFDHRTFHPGKYYIERGRLNDRYGQPFSCEKDISYRTDIEQIKNYGRANRIHRSMWYGSFKTKEQPCPVVTIWGEMKVRWSEFRCHDFTVGRWKVVKDIELVNILMEDDPRFKELRDSIYKKVKDTLEREKIIGVTKFMAEEFSKEVKDNENYNYKISAAFTDIILEKTFIRHGKRKHFDGIIYPSVEKNGGLNIALTPQAVNNCLRLETAFCYEFCGQDERYRLYTPAEMVAYNSQSDESPFQWQRNVRV